MKKPKLVVILGPTAAGKSALAVRLARRLNGEIVSADSRQVYRGLDIGAGKITRREMRGVRHHLLDVADPRKRFTAAEYKMLAERAIGDIADRGKLPIVCGGTGFYIETLADNILLPPVGPDEELRKKLSGKTAAALLPILRRIDPRRARTIDPRNARRIIRAIEIAAALGAVPRPRRAARYDAIRIGITLPRAELKSRIALRLSARMRKGMIAEARRLHRRGLSWKRMEELGLEYRFLSRFLRGALQKSEMTEQLGAAIRRYAKRQMTWFRRDRRVRWFRPDEFEKIEAAVKLARKSSHER